MLTFCILSSGSKANCLYVTDGQTRVLVDCGLSAREAAKRLSSRGVDADSIDAIVITHEHADHVKGVRVFSKRHNADVFANRDTFAHAKDLQEVNPEKVKEFHTGHSFAIGGVLFEPFSLVHDAIDPVGFCVRANGTSLAVATDLGQVTTLVRERTRDVNALVLESNHDIEMLRAAPYPWELKQRISSRKGHLSNESAGSLIEELSAHKASRLEIIIAAHISENSNLPELAMDSFLSSWKNGGASVRPQFIAASAQASTEIFTI